MPCILLENEAEKEFLSFALVEILKIRTERVNNGQQTSRVELRKGHKGPFNVEWCTDKCRKQDIGSFSIKAAPPFAFWIQDLWPGTRSLPHNAKQVKRSANNKMVATTRRTRTMSTTKAVAVAVWQRQRNVALRFNNLPQD